MKRTQIRKKAKRTRTIRKKKGGDCGCNKKPFTGGYGEASYQGGLDRYINPINTNQGGANDPLSLNNITNERFAKYVGGKKSRKYRKRNAKYGGGFPSDLLLGESAQNNPILGLGTSLGTINMAKVITGKN
jgi:hypothetical protein